MFDPECQNIECPKCLLGKIYFDREIGYYCMYCGHQFSTMDMKIHVGKIGLTLLSAHQSDKGRKKPVVEIKELLPRKAKIKHFRRNQVKSKKPDG